MKAGLYARISRDRTGLQAGVERQERECRELADRLGWDVERLYVDNDISAFNGKRRQAYERLLEDVKDGAIAAILAWHPDRLYKRARELVGFVDIVSGARAKVATVQSGEVDLTTPDGRMIARIVGAVNEREGEHKGERHRAKDRQLHESGRPHGGPRAYGYRYEGGTLRIVPHEADIVRELARRVLAGESVHELARELNGRGVQTARAKDRWHHNTISRLLRSPTLAAIRVRHEDRDRPGDWEPILPMDQHRALVALLTDPGRLASRAPRRYLLTGIARCGLCGDGLQARPKWDRRRNYLCRSCGKIGVLAEPLEALVVEAVIRRVDAGDIAAHLQEESAGGTEELEAQLQELAEMWSARQITQKEWLAARAPLQRELETKRREDAGRARALAIETFRRDGLLRSAWPKMPLATRRAVLTAVLDQVTVGAAVRGRNRFDPDRLTIRWRV